MRSHSLYGTAVLKKYAEIFRSACTVRCYNIRLLTVSSFEWNYMINMPKPKSMNKDDNDDDDDYDDDNNNNNNNNNN